MSTPADLLCPPPLELNPGDGFGSTKHGCQQCWQHYCHGDELNDNVNVTRHVLMVQTLAEMHYSTGLRRCLVRCTPQVCAASRAFPRVVVGDFEGDSPARSIELG